MKKSIFLIILLAMLWVGSAQAQAVSFEVRNERVVGSNYEFDVYMAADQLGTFHSRGQVYVNYNPAAFGSQLVSSGNVTVTQLSLLKENIGGTGKYATINATDNAPGVVAFTWQNNFVNQAPSATFHTEVLMVMTPLYHVSMKLIDPAAATKVSLNSKLMKGQQFYLISANGEEKAYREGAAAPFAFLTISADKANDHDVLLNWSTTNEGGTDFFVIEKQKENGSFAELTKTGAKNTSGTNTYEYLDQSGMANTVTYRVQQVGFDGAVVFSDVVEVKFGDLVENDKFVVYPSPASDFTYLKAKGQMNADHNFYVSDINGKVVFEGLLEKGAANGEVKINLTGYAEGTYIVKTTSPDGKSYLNKLVKVNQ
jgi:hypothetical protein